MSSTTKKRKLSELSIPSVGPSILVTGTSAYENLPETFSKLRLIDLSLNPNWIDLTGYRREFLINEKKCHHLLTKIQAVNDLQNTADFVVAAGDRRSSVRLIEKAAQSQLTLNKKKLAKYRTKLTPLKVISRDLKVSIKREETEIAAEQEKMKVARHWGAPLAWKNLPDELVLIVMEYLGYVHQQRLIRVSQSWKHFITAELDHIYLDAASLYQSHINKYGFLILQQAWLNAYISHDDRVRQELHQSLVRLTKDPAVKATLPWKFNRRSVRQLTFNGQYVAHFTPASECVVQLASSQFPALIQINFVQTVLDLPNESKQRTLDGYLAAQSSGRRITMSNCIIPAFPGGLDTIFHDDRGKREHCRAEERRILGCFQESYVRLADITWTSEEEFRQFRQGILPLMELTWPYPDGQTEWLTRWAPCLNENERLLKLLRRFERESWMDPMDAGDKVVAMCKEHGCFCDHLDISFYKELNGEARNLIAVYLLQLRPPGMEPPPVPFKFEKFHLRKGKCVRFGPV